jgi:cell shape-determining protein MreC
MTVLKRADRSHSFQSQKEKEVALQQLQEATERAEQAAEKAASAEAENQRLREQLALARQEAR